MTSDYRIADFAATDQPGVPFVAPAVRHAPWAVGAMIEAFGASALVSIPLRSTLRKRGHGRHRP